MYFRLIQRVSNAECRREFDEAKRKEDLCGAMKGGELGQGQWARLRDES